mmetsp:Transcript_29360/g.72344  ORF Transcript_29360/g.72344 Transcript_29360/m.72344 type:complete len:212 (+) Transcript_29360:303-938(+)
MMYMTDGLTMSTKFTGMAIFSGEAVAKVRFTNNTDSDGHVGMATNMPMACVIPIHMEDYGGQLNCKRGAYMAGDETVKVGVKILPARSTAACCCGGMPPVIQGLSGSGMALINAGGTLVKKDLANGEILIIDSDSLVAFTDTIAYDVRRVGSLLTCCCGGEGMFNTSLMGPGTVWLQTLSYDRLISQLVTVREAAAAGAAGGAAASSGGDE